MFLKSRFENSEDLRSRPNSYRSLGRLGDDIGLEITFSPTKRASKNIEELSFVDRCHFYLKYLDENIDIDLPYVLYAHPHDLNFSINQNGYDLSRVIDEIVLYMSRVEKLMDSMMFLKEDGTQREYSAINSKWQNLLANNKLKELLLEMNEYYQNVGDIDNLKLSVMLTQRLNKTNEENSKGIIKPEQYNLELRQITSSIIDILFKKG